MPERLPISRADVPEPHAASLAFVAPPLRGAADMHEVLAGILAAAFEGASTPPRLCWHVDPQTAHRMRVVVLLPLHEALRMGVAESHSPTEAADRWAESARAALGWTAADGTARPLIDAAEARAYPDRFVKVVAEACDLSVHQLPERPAPDADAYREVYRFSARDFAAQSPELRALYGEVEAVTAGLGTPQQREREAADRLRSLYASVDVAQKAAGRLVVAERQADLLAKDKRAIEVAEARERARADAAEHARAKAAADATAKDDLLGRKDAQLRSLQDRLAETENEAAALRHAVERVMGSASWRVTRPARGALIGVRRAGRAVLRRPSAGRLPGPPKE